MRKAGLGRLVFAQNENWKPWEHLLDDKSSWLWCTRLVNLIEYVPLPGKMYKNNGKIWHIFVITYIPET